MTEALVTGLELFFAGALGLFRVLILEPRMSKYPSSSLITRSTIYLFSAGCCIIGFQLLCVWHSGIIAVPPGPQSKLQLLAHLTLIYKFGMTWNLLRQRLPASVWDRLNRMSAKAHCWPR